MPQCQWIIVILYLLVCRLNAVNRIVVVNSGETLTISGKVTLGADVTFQTDQKTKATVKVVGGIDVSSSINLTLKDNVVLDLSDLTTSDTSKITVQVVSDNKPEKISDFLILPKNNDVVTLSNVTFSSGNDAPQKLTLTQDNLVIKSNIPEPTPDQSILIQALTINAVQNAGAILNALNSVKSGGSSQSRQNKADHIHAFQQWIKKNPQASTELRLKTMIKSICEEPISLEKNEIRIWFSPYFSSSRTTTSDSKLNSTLYGGLIGTEYKSTSFDYTIGGLLGLHSGTDHENGSTINKTTYTGMNYGLYHSKGLWVGGRYDVFLNKSSNNLKRTGIDPINKKEVSSAKNKLTSHIIDFQMSHLIKEPENIWSTRFNIGHTYVHYQTSPYKDFISNVSIASITGRSAEIYGGIGVRWNMMTKQIRIRITGVYEFGHEYKKAGGNTIASVHSATPIQAVILKPDQQKMNTHYITLNVSILDPSSQWKFFIGYNGSIQANTINNAFALKAEWRF